MKNIIKAEFLKLRKDKFCRILFLVFLIAGAWTVSSSMGVLPDGKKYAGDNAVMALVLVPFIIQFFCVHLFRMHVELILRTRHIIMK